MDSYAGTTLMGSQPVAGRARAVDVCDSGRSTAAAHLVWQAGLMAKAFQAKPATHTIVAVPDTNRTRRPRGTP